jgi:hypothetical protein
MIMYMRTTLVLDDDLVRSAKQQAVKAGVTLSEWVSRAVRDALSVRDRQVSRFEMITYGQSEPRVLHEPADFAEVSHDDDQAKVGR